MCFGEAKRTFQKNSENPFDLRSFLGRFLNPSPKVTKGSDLVGPMVVAPVIPHCCPSEVPGSLRSYVKFLEEHTSVSLESAAEDSLKISKVGDRGGKQGEPLGIKVDRFWLQTGGFSDSL